MFVYAPTRESTRREEIKSFGIADSFFKTFPLLRVSRSMMKGVLLDRDVGKSATEIHYFFSTIGRLEIDVTPLLCQLHYYES